jgi:predicted amidophosphoribosyltransferase
MDLHRSEIVIPKNGSLIPVSFISLYEHDGPIRDLVIDLKYHGMKPLAREIAQLMSPIIMELGEVEAITWAPTSALHHLERGFDHSELIARHCAGITKIVHRKLLRRVNNEHQTGKGRQQRLEQPLFVARPLGPKRICVVDDVLTTGATLAAAAHALIERGAQRVWCVSVTYVR